MIRAAAVTTAAFGMSAGAFAFFGARLGLGWAEPLSLAAAGAGMAVASLFLSPKVKGATGVTTEDHKPQVAPVETQRATA